MSEPQIRLTLDKPSGQYQAGERISGRFMVEGSHHGQTRAVELAVLWYTAGKGDEDMAVQHFERLVDDPARPLDLRVPHRFATHLPPSPLSYDGIIVKVCWCVRLRLFLSNGHEAVAETAFRMGDIPPPTLPDASTVAEELR